MSSEIETGELPAIGDANQVAAPGEPVGRINLPVEPDPEYDEVAEPASSPNEGMREKILFGVLTVALMVFALVVILQGVFEQKMPV